MKEKEFVTGYKVFNRDWTCNPTGNNPKQYSCPGIFKENVTPSAGNEGMHFCKELKDCFNDYSFDPNNKVAKVIALGEIDEDGATCCTNKLQIVEEINWEDVLKMVNLGNKNVGLGNSGDCNNGDYNSGDYNKGSFNSDDYNNGNFNSGKYNNGDCNSGKYNNGDYNSGYCNNGNRNSGSYNKGNYNSGNNNKGYRNSGDWNTTDHSNGCFNTEEPKIFLFNKPSDWTYRDWINSNAKRLLNQISKNVAWIDSKNMTDEEKEQHPEYEVVGGYLKSLDESEYRLSWLDFDKLKSKQSWWDSLPEEDKNIITAIPNFDEEIFEECTGIKIQEADMTLLKKANAKDNCIKETAVIEAVKINSFSEKDVENVLVFIGENADVDEITQTKFAKYCLCCKKRGFMYIKNQTDGLLEAHVGDYIVRGANGDCYPCKPETFEFLKKIMK